MAYKMDGDKNVRSNQNMSVCVVLLVAKYNMSHKQG